MEKIKEKLVLRLEKEKQAASGTLARLGTARHGLAVEHRGLMKPGKSPKIRGFDLNGKIMGKPWDNTL